MVDDPYKVLGISRDATKEEIKKAYRAKAKEYHPDLHPDDPQAAEKMNEINEAYDMLNNPEKYRRRAQEEQGRGGYQPGGRWDAGGGQRYGGGQQYGGGQWNSSGGWQDYGDFRGFGSFDDFFGFGGMGQEPERPQPRQGDSGDIRQAIDFINMRQYRYANDTLNSILSAYRDARWFYLSALANYGLNNQVLAVEQIQKAIEKDPSEPLYRRTLSSLQRSGTEYRQNSEEFQNYADSMGRFCQGLCLAQLFCMFCRC